MPTENQYEKIFRPLLTALEQDRARVDGTGPTAERYAVAIIAARGRIEEAQAVMPRALKNKEGEVFYFRQVWPRIYGRLFYYQKIHGFLTDHAIRDEEGLATVIRREEMEARRFFRINREFWQYYNGGSSVIDAQFTRAYSRECIFDPLCMVIDQLGATLASYKAACRLAYGWYLDFLNRRRGTPPGGMTKGRRKWKESSTAALELLKAQEEAESIEIDGERATMPMLVADFEATYDYSLGDYNKLLYAATGRKINSAPYLSKLMNAFTGRRSRLRK